MKVNAQMMLLDLPNELLCQISEDLHTVTDIASFTQVNSQLNQLTVAHLYRFDARELNSSALLWAGNNGGIETAKRALKEWVREEHTETETETKPSIDAALVLAAEGGYEDLVRLLVNSGAHTYWRDPDRRQNAMEAASTQGHTRIVELLIELGADPRDGTLLRPFSIQCAAMMGHTEIVRLLIDAGESPDRCTGRPEGGCYPPLQHAVRMDHEETAKLLIAKGATINLRIGRMHTALEEAVMSERLWAVRLLLNSGAMVFAPRPDYVRRPALKMAKKPGREQIFELLKDEKVHTWPKLYGEE